jgi:hypothetical protein
VAEHIHHVILLLQNGGPQIARPLMLELELFFINALQLLTSNAPFAIYSLPLEGTGDVRYLPGAAVMAKTSSLQGSPAPRELDCRTMTKAPDSDDAGLTRREEIRRQSAWSCS